MKEDSGKSAYPFKKEIIPRWGNIMEYSNEKQLWVGGDFRVFDSMSRI